MSRLLLEVPRTLRTLARSPGFTVPAVLVLAIAIGAETAIFTVFDGVLRRPLALPSSEQLVSLCEHHPTLESYCVMSPPNAVDLAEGSATVEGIGVARDWPFVLSGPTISGGVRGGLATPEFFRLLRVQPRLGRLFAADEVGPGRDGVALLTHEFWTSRFGADSGVVGRTLVIDGTPNVIVGVLPSSFVFPSLSRVELWKPLHVDPRGAEVRRWRGFLAVARLRDGADLRGARSELRDRYANLGRTYPEITPEWQLGVTSLLDAHVGDVRTTLVLFLTAVTVLLMIACANIANLLLVRGAQRRHQLAIRTALGARRADLAADVMLESLVLAALGGGGGLVIGWWATGAFLAAAPPGIPRLDEVGFSLRAFAFAGGVSLATALIFGGLPALRTGAGDLSSTFRTTRMTASGKQRRAMRILTVAELGLSLALLATGGLVYRTFDGFARWEPGYHTADVLTFSMQFPRTRYPNVEVLRAGFDEVEAALRAIPGVAEAGMVSGWPLLGGIEPRPYVADGRSPDPGADPPAAHYFEVSPGLLGALDVRIVTGRSLQPTDRGDSPAVVVVNETLARTTWPGEDAIGRRIYFPDHDETAEVVGVVQDLPPLTPGAPVPAEVYWSNRQHSRPVPYVVVRTETDAAALIPAVRARLTAVDPELSVASIQPFTDVVARHLVAPRFTLYLVTGFAFTALVLAVLGIYGVLAFAVAQRRREFGIRLALGATRARVIRGVLIDGGVLAVFGVALGLVVTYAASSLLGRVVHGVPPDDPVTMAAAAGGLLAAATMASLVPALRASRVSVRSVLVET